MNDILFAIWFFLPAGFANVAPILAAKIPMLKRWKTPIDFNHTLHGQSIFGKNKTWRGIVSGIVFSSATVFVQQQTNSAYTITFLHNHTSYLNQPALLLGTLFTIGALGGDLIESFFKRRANIAPGKAWFPFDQTDYIIGTFIALSPVITLNISEYISILLVWFFAHLIFSYIGYLTGFKKSPI